FYSKNSSTIGKFVRQCKIGTNIVLSEPLSLKYLNFVRSTYRKGMKLRFFNKTIEHRSFRYTPMYYDEQKEYIEMKKAQHRDVSKEEIDFETRKEILKHELSSSWSRT